MDEKVKENIERLGEIMVAMSMVKIGKELEDELDTIMNYLKVMQVVEMEVDGRGFSFTDETYKELFIDSRDNF
jgi:hypothetical protein